MGARTSHRSPLLESLAAKDVGRGARLLIVDDSPGLAQLYAKALQPQGFIATGARNANEAWQQIVTAEHKPDCVITDLVMPGIFDGMELCRRLRTSRHTENMGLIVMTAKPHEEEAAIRALTRCDAVFFKPFAINEMRNQIVDVLRKRRRTS